MVKLQNTDGSPVHTGYKIKIIVLGPNRSFGVSARKTEFDADGPKINENLVVLKTGLQLQRHELVGAQNTGPAVIGSVFRT